MRQILTSRAPLALALLFPLLGSGCESTKAGPAVDSYVQAADGTLLHYTKVGAGAPTLIVPGSSFIGPDMAQLAKGRTVVFYDMRGRGKSTSAMSVRLDQDISDLDAVRAWFGVESVALLATDYRAVVATLYAAENPQRVSKLVLVSPIPIRRDPFYNIYERVWDDRRDDEAFKALAVHKREGLNRRDPDRWAYEYKLALFRPFVLDASALKRMKGTPFMKPNQDPEKAVRLHLSVLRALQDWDWRSDLGPIACPTLVISGESDPVPAQGTQEWVSSIRGARGAIIAKSARLPWIEQPRPFFRTVEGFLAP